MTRTLPNILLQKDILSKKILLSTSSLKYKVFQVRQAHHTLHRLWRGTGEGCHLRKNLFPGMDGVWKQVVIIIRITYIICSYISYSIWWKSSLVVFCFPHLFMMIAVTYSGTTFVWRVSLTCFLSNDNPNPYVRLYARALYVCMCACIFSACVCSRSDGHQCDVVVGHRLTFRCRCTQWECVKGV